LASAGQFRRLSDIVWTFPGLGEGDASYPAEPVGIGTTVVFDSLVARQRPGDPCAMSGWLDGWVGGVLAAAATVLATFWWDTRIRRRSKLDDAVAALSASAWDVGNAALRMRSGPRVRDSELAASVRALVLSLLEVQAHAFRPRLGRSRGLALTVKGFADALGDLQSGKFSRRDWPQLARLCIAMQTACYEWMRSPRMYRRRIDRSKALLDRVVLE
jgi:hypothetical protein